MMYQVKFRTSGIVAFSSTDRGVCQHWLECNDYAPETPYTDPDTGEVDPSRWVRGDCLNLFKLMKVK
jgi:hypothetical protein